jgi:2-keto-4-pentenoate hydratase
VEVYAGDALLQQVNVLVETVNGLGDRGFGFAAGEILSTGSLTVPMPLRRGETLVARFGDLSELAVSLV